MTLFTGSVANFASGHEPSGTEWAAWADAIQALTDPWSVYTPTGSGTGFGLGNGTVDGRWFQAGKQVRGLIHLVCGSTTNFGTAGLQFTLPVANRSGGARLLMANANLLDFSTGHTIPILGLITAGGTGIAAVFLNTIGSNVISVTNTAPLAIGVSDELSLDFGYETS